MTFQGDPYRTLGIAPGASLNEIRSRVPAARQAVPPRRGGRARAAAVPRDPGGLRAARRRARGGCGPRRGGDRCVVGEDAGEPWRARFDARATALAGGLAGAARRGIGGGRRPETGRGIGSGGPAAGDATAPRRRRRWSAGERPRTREAPPRERHTRRGFRARRPRARRPTTRPPTRRSTRSGRAAPGTARRRGTYWTINPREYADPRKHGPEYQARARRAAAGRGRRRPAPGAGPRRRPIGDPAEPRHRAAPAPTAAGAERRRAGCGRAGRSTTGGGAGWGTRGWRYEDVPPDDAHRGGPEAAASARRAASAPTRAAARPRGARRARLAREPARRSRAGATARWRLGRRAHRLAADRLRGRHAARRRVTGCAAFSRVVPRTGAAARRSPSSRWSSRRCSPCRRPRRSAAFAAIVALAVAVPVAAVLSVGTGPGSRVGGDLLGVAVAGAYLVALVARHRDRGVARAPRAADRGRRRRVPGRRLGACTAATTSRHLGGRPGVPARAAGHGLRRAGSPRPPSSAATSA